MSALVIGVDPSLTATGLAHADGSTSTVHYDKACDGDLRLRAIYADVTDACFPEGHRIGLAVVEDLPTHAHGAGKTGMAQGTVRLALVDAMIPYVTVTAATLKKLATGRGNATKPDMRMELYRRTGLDVRDDNQVDAAWLRHLGLALLGHPAFDLPKTHLAALDKVTLPEGVAA